MIFMCEFEIVRGEHAWMAFPFGLDGGTQGTNFEDTVRSAAVWMRMTALDSLAGGWPFPDCQLGNDPQRGGKVVAIAIEASLSEVPAMTAKEAAGLLGVSQGRIAQLCAAGLLDSWKVGRTRMVSVESVELRLAQERGAGRPKRSKAIA